MSKGRMTSYRKLAHALVQELRHEDLSEVMVRGLACGDPVPVSERKAVQVTLTYVTQDGEVYQGTGISYKNPSDEYVLSTAVRIARGRAELSLGMQMLVAAFGEEQPDYLGKTLLKSVHRLPGDIKWEDVASRKQRSLSQDDITLLLNLLDDEDMLVLSVEQPLP